MSKIVSFFGTHNAVFDELNDRAKQYAADKGFDYVWSVQSPFSQADVIAQLKQADAGIIDIEPYGADIFSQIHDTTKLLVRFGVGYDKVDLKAASEYGIAVARTTGANTMGVAEMAVALMLAARRQINQNRAVAQKGDWTQRIVCHETVGGTIGIVGFGAIGRVVARLVSGFGCKVIAYDPIAQDAMPKDENVEFVDLDTLFTTADAVTLHVPYTPETHGLVDAARLKTMKPDAVLVNTSRGSIVDEAALYEALKDGVIGGAALDVFAEEPLPLTSPLFTLDNIILMPHVSSQTVESLWRVYAMAIDIAADFFAGKPVKDILNPGYNSQRTV